MDSNVLSAGVVVIPEPFYVFVIWITDTVRSKIRGLYSFNSSFRTQRTENKE